MSGAVILRGPMASDHYTQIHNRIVRGDLPPRYVGPYGYIASHRVGWQCSEKQLAKDLNVGREYVRAALAAMEKALLLVRGRYREPDGTLGGAIWWVSDLAMQLRQLGVDEPTIRRQVEAQAQEQISRCSPGSENQTQASTCENTPAAEPGAEPVPAEESFPRSNPKSGKPTLDKPTLVDPHTKKTKGLEDLTPEKTTPPSGSGTPPPAPRRSPEQGGAGTGRKGTATHPGSLEAAREVLAGVLTPVPHARRPRAQRRVRLETEIARALSRGWSAQQIADLLGGSLAGVGSVAGVLASRLDGLADEDPPPAGGGQRDEIPPWCGECEAPELGRRFRVRDPDVYGNGTPVRCHVCHPYRVNADTITSPV